VDDVKVSQQGLVNNKIVEFQVFRDTTPCELVISYQYFRGTHFLHLQGSGRSHIPKYSTFSNSALKATIM